jgi:hypothetical protein
MEVHMNHPEPAHEVLPETGESPPAPGYEEDFVLWLFSQAQLLRERKFEALDVDNLIEEIEGMGRSDRRALRHRVSLVLVHLLKCKFQPEQRSRGWLGTLVEQRRRISHLIKDSPSLRRLVAEYAHEEYESAVSQAAKETGLPTSTFPPSSPFSEAELLDPDFLP